LQEGRSFEKAARPDQYKQNLGEKINLFDFFFKAIARAKG
jgi:hypothetical protein